MPPLRICQVASEVTPFAKTGGLGDVVAGLSRFLGQAGHDVRVFLPFYAPIASRSEQFVAVDFLREIPLAMGSRQLTFTALTTKLPESAVDVYFIHCPALYHYDGIYSGAWDEYLRFAFFSRAALECCQRMGWSPHVIHCHDWHTGLIPLYLRTAYNWDQLFARTRTLLTLHNLGYQGTYSTAVLEDLDLAQHSHLLYHEDLARGAVSFLKTGLLYADWLSTVSRTYAFEIRTPDYGFGLHELLEVRSDHLSGIVNGVDFGEWNPAADPHLPHRYSARDLAGKWRMRRALLDRVGLPFDRTAPVVGLVSRLTAQKGVDLFFEVLPELLAARNLRFIALGSGESRYESFFAWLGETFRGKAWYFRGFHNELAHWIEAGADIFVMPSRYEPCGLNQMYSLRYGTPPVVRRTGGLADTVEPFDPATGAGTGFVFDHFTPEGLRWGLESALAAWRHRPSWRRLMANGMARDFSWEAQGPHYVNLYRHLITLRG